MEASLRPYRTICPNKPRIDRKPLQVLFTIDTEVWPHYSDWQSDLLARDIARDIEGLTPSGAFGLDFQIQMLSTYQLKAIFFVESLFAGAVGIQPLQRIIQKIQEANQETQLHAHAEWAQWLPNLSLNHLKAKNFRDLSKTDQETLLSQARANMQAAGQLKFSIFRAGNFGANLDTLRALKALDIPIDMSYSWCMKGNCGLIGPGFRIKPHQIEEIWEIPLTFIEDRPGHHRPVQIGSISSDELTKSLEAAWLAGWSHFVILSHSFELIRGRGVTKSKPRPNRIAIHRMQTICKYLDANRDRFETVHSQNLTLPSSSIEEDWKPIRGSFISSTRRQFEQVAMRLW